MSSPNPVRLGGLSRKLVEQGLLTAEDAAQAESDSQKKKIPLISFLSDTKKVNEIQLASIAADEFGMPLLDLAALDLEQLPKEIISEKLMLQHHAVALAKRGKKLHIAISDPMNLSALDELKFATGMMTEPVIVAHSALSKLIEDLANAADTDMSSMEMDDDLDNLKVTAEDENDQGGVDESNIDETPVVRFVNKILLDAINKKASDIHVEPYEKKFRVRLRIDGVLTEVAQPPLQLAPRIIARIKVMSRMDISERRIPQDGRIKMQLSKNRAIDFRVNTCPTLFGEKIVLRILDPSSAQLGIDALGYEEVQKQAYMEALAQPFGLILVTGPTGSGKTVSLYTGLNILNTPDRNISTAEDPAEINLYGINQVNMNPKVGLTFAEALRAFLRQDPDIIMVGEIRDLETAEIAIKAAQTGHMVLSTLHTNDAPQTLTRLMNMGVPHFNLATSITLIIAQRLARRLCKHCKTEEKDIPRETLLEEGFTEEDLKELKLYKAVGCDQCTEGYKGRVGIYQVMPISDATSRLIMEGKNSIDIADQARKEGINDIRRSGLMKAMQGVTSLEEINRVTRD